MTSKFKAYWDRLCRANPQLNDPATKMTITCASLLKEIEKAFEEGRKHPVTSQKDVSDAAEDFAKFGRKESASDIFGAFGDMFGGGK